MTSNYNFNKPFTIVFVIEIGKISVVKIVFIVNNSRNNTVIITN